MAYAGHKYGRPDYTDGSEEAEEGSYPKNLPRNDQNRPPKLQAVNHMCHFSGTRTAAKKRVRDDLRTRNSVSPQGNYGRAGVIFSDSPGFGGVDSVFT